MTTKTIKVDFLARVEGEGALHVKIKDGKVTDAHLTIFEPPRFFEALLRGRAYTEAPDITARICGICPVAYQMSSVHAMERAGGVTVGGQLRELRRLLYCGEWIESHALHIYMLHAPDFLGYPDSIRLAQNYPEIVQRGLQLKKVGNQIMTLLGGREIHPINVRVGGFYKVPTRAELGPLAERLRWAREAALDTVRWVATLPFPDFEQDYEFVALHHPKEYALNEGRVVSSQGLDIPVDDYESVFREEHVERSTALHSVLTGKERYLVGPLARYNLNFDQLTPAAQEAAREAGLGRTCRNPFRSIIVRAVETVYACDEAIRIIEQYEMPDHPFVTVPARSSVGRAATEAPRGLLYHRYTIDSRGDIVDAKIVPPTSQNLRTIEHDLRQVVTENIELPKDALTLRCELTVRNYDPCISCSTHYLRLELEYE
jgi:sulfhydrogenase subunit alpha